MMTLQNTSATSPLQTELDYYYSIKQSLIDDGKENQFAVIKGTNLIGCYDSYETGLEQGYKAAGLDGFLIKQVEANETVHVITRMLDLFSLPKVA